MSSGQYDHPRACSTAGTTRPGAKQTLRHVLQEHGRRCRRLAWIDLHTGLGPSGPRRTHLGRAGRCRGRGTRPVMVGPEVTSIYDGFSRVGPCSPADVAGQRARNARRPNTPASRWNTAPCPSTRDRRAARRPVAGEIHPDAPPALRTQIKRQIRDAGTYRPRCLEGARRRTRRAGRAPGGGRPGPPRCPQLGMKTAHG